MSNIYNLGRDKPKKQISPDEKYGKYVEEYKIPDEDVVRDVLNQAKKGVERFDNPIQALYEAAERAMQNVKIFHNTKDYEPFYMHPREQKKVEDMAKETDSKMPYKNFFNTIQIDNGQFDRIILKDNTEGDVLFPAVFIRFVNIRYLVAQQRIGEGRATMRIRFILNNLNNKDWRVETMPFRVMQLINTSIQNASSYEEAFSERVNLTFNDIPERTNMLQAYWVDYEVWFKDYSAWVYNNYISKHLVIPPFTNHSDAPELDVDNHGDHKTPTYDDATKIKRPFVKNDENENI